MIKELKELFNSKRSKDITKRNTDKIVLKRIQTKYDDGKKPNNSTKHPKENNPEQDKTKPLLAPSTKCESLPHT